MRGAVAAIALLLSACDAGTKVATPAPAPNFAGAAEIDRARAAAAEGKLDRAADLLGDALRVIEDAGPLRIRNLQLVDKEVRGFGIYTPLKTPPKPGENLFVYFEPAGMTHAFRDGFWHVDLSADLALLLTDGTVAQELPDFWVSEVASHAPNREIQIVMRLLGTGLPEGEYLMRVTLHDKLGRKIAVEKLPLSLKR